MPGVNIEMLENSIKLANAKVTVWEQKRAAYNTRETKHRAFVQALIDSQFPTQGSIQGTALQIPVRQACSNYLQYHKIHADAELQIIDLTIAELKSQAAIHQAMLDEAMGKVIAPGTGRVRM